MGYFNGGIRCGRYHWICVYDLDFNASGSRRRGQPSSTGFDGFGAVLCDGDDDGDFVLAI